MASYEYPSVSYEVADRIQKATGREVRVTVPGHTQRAALLMPMTVSSPHRSAL